MTDDDDMPRVPKKRLEKQSLDHLSIADLQEYIGELRGEIARVEGVIAGKQAARGSAEGFFKKPMG
jgi:uncharacterized small protein (DUF1192 family)